jgi:hypothetical protein
MIGFSRFRVDVSDSIDPQALSKLGNCMCIPAIKQKSVAQLVKIDPARVGKTGLSGAIVYYSLKNEWTELYRKYLAETGGSTDSTLRARAFYSYDIFQKTWLLNAIDVGPITGTFRTNTVAERLQ